MSEELSYEEFKKRVQLVIDLIEASLSIEKSDMIKSSALLTLIVRKICMQENPIESLEMTTKTILRGTAELLKDIMEEAIEKTQPAKDGEPEFWQPI